MNFQGSGYNSVTKSKSCLLTYIKEIKPELVPGPYFPLIKIPSVLFVLFPFA